MSRGPRLVVLIKKTVYLTEAINRVVSRYATRSGTMLQINMNISFSSLFVACLCVLIKVHAFASPCIFLSSMYLRSISSEHLCEKSGDNGITRLGICETKTGFEECPPIFFKGELKPAEQIALNQTERENISSGSLRLVS